VDQQRLPRDAAFKGYQDVVVQDILFRPENILFRKEKYYPPQPEADVSGSFTKRLSGAIWAGSTSLGIGLVLRRGDE
jgi:hypothetical protein